ncbi:MAG: DUF1566 domain-containing protein [Nitrospinota bacterium]|nr:DUF1566 domain-containing protein [Nitrospinota bacterium]
MKWLLLISLFLVSCGVPSGNDNQAAPGTTDVICEPPTDIRYKSITVRGKENVNDQQFPDSRFVKLDVSGKPLSDQTAKYSTQAWQCVEDKELNVIWEVKTLGTDHRGLRDYRNTFTYPPDGDSPYTCTMPFYINAVNDIAFCGRTNWTLPTAESLLSLAGKYDMFPDTVFAWHATSDFLVQGATKGQAVYFEFDKTLLDIADLQHSNYYAVRLMSKNY